MAKTEFVDANNVGNRIQSMRVGITALQERCSQLRKENAYLRSENEELRLVIARMTEQMGG